MTTAHRPIRHRASDPLEAARAELAEARAHEEHLRQLVAEGKASADALATAQYRVSCAGKAIARLLAALVPDPEPCQEGGACEPDPRKDQGHPAAGFIPPRRELRSPERGGGLRDSQAATLTDRSAGFCMSPRPETDERGNR